MKKIIIRILSIRTVILLLSFWLYVPAFTQLNISINTSEQLLQDPCTKLAIEDLKDLLQKANNCFLITDTNETDLILDLPNEIVANEQTDAYNWHKVNKTLYLTAHSSKGIANGIYGLLQEIFGFKFYHPREMIIPDYSSYTIPQFKNFSGNPSFNNIGFHLHTMHPIELTEDLLDEKREGGLQRVYEYIDWLARNGQNYFEFNLLESVELESWVEHASLITNYAHQRGIRCGLDLSLHMLQQKAFQLYETPPYNFTNIKKQIQQKMQVLYQARFDLWNVELSATEFTAGDQTKKKEILLYLTHLLDKYGIELMSRNHVVKPDQMINDGKGVEAADILSDNQGLMVHTVMFYSLTDERAPVYRNKNLKHMHEILQKEKNKRPVWYFPESSYWVTFDSSVPMLLLPYLSARLSDITLCEQENINGHLTFTSGWEWGYGYIDWSIARWCWNYKLDDKEVERSALQFVNELISEKFSKYIVEEEQLQQKYIKDKELIRVLVAQTVTDEIPGPFNLEFHPRPVYSYKFIRNKASHVQLDTIQQLYLDPLSEYYLQGLNLDSNYGDFSLNPREREIFESIQITHLRAWHKYETLNYLVALRRNNLNQIKTNIQKHLDEAARIRLLANAIVSMRESKYRYDINLLTTKYSDHTCYHFGYLYPVHELHFWKREEIQAKNNNYDFWFRSIWDVGRTVGFYD